MVQLCSGAVVQLFSGAVVQWCSGAVVQGCSRAKVQGCSGAGVQECSGEVVERTCSLNDETNIIVIAFMHHFRLEVVQRCSCALVQLFSGAVV